MLKYAEKSLYCYTEILGDRYLDSTGVRGIRYERCDRSIINYLPFLPLVIAIFNWMGDICRGAQLCAPTDRVFSLIENRYNYGCGKSVKLA
ncbi:hypothetical protein IQ272_05710 [Chroococcidiopsidales cyanobacterium LEGE 13417]|uniref:hypothetical protein n=1 Tax=Chroococcidiopsis sp. CCALA 051 TaxID=869949 RepID=UPI0011B24FC5|nr:hypothetical protein [Chroococcidiopsis sp. CCALA 051]MBE9015646.1 hypothetical protein [Chroococcidiopsidales cyanobacterium LEGE 13417]